MAGLSDSLLGLEGRLSIYMIYTKKVCSKMFFVSKNQAKFLNLINIEK